MLLTCQITFPDHSLHFPLWSSFLLDAAATAHLLDFYCPVEREREREKERERE
jgi:hypothetical protein